LKKCPGCKKVKRNVDFGFRRMANGKLFLQSYCKDCRNCRRTASSLSFLRGDAEIRPGLRKRGA
jgi:hypothetical protein